MSSDRRCGMCEISWRSRSSVRMNNTFGFEEREPGAGVEVCVELQPATSSAVTVKTPQPRTRIPADLPVEQSSRSRHHHGVKVHSRSGRGNVSVIPVASKSALSYDQVLAG